MRFTLKQLQYVEATARLGSISRAAAELNISQSSITAAIGAVESQIGFDIFVRTPAKGVSLTPVGAETLDLIHGFMVQSRHFETALQSVGGDASGSVRIACYATAAPSFLPPILHRFKSVHPSTSVKLLEGDMEAAITYLTQGEADLAFVYQDVVEEAQEFTPLFSAPPYALMPLNDPLARQPWVRMADLADKPMVLLDLPRTKEYFTSLFQEAGLRPNLVHSTQSAEIARALVSVGYGFSILNICPPDYRADDPRFRTVPIRDKVHTPIFGIATMAGLRQPSVVTTFIDHCVDLQRAGAFDAITVS